MLKSLFSGWFEKDWHPSEDELLTYVDGGLTSRKTTDIASHLEQCWSCRAKAERIQQTVLSFVDYFDRVITPNVPAPPMGWRSFPGQLERVMRECRRPTVLSRCRASLMWTLSTASRHLRLAMGILIALFTAFLGLRFYQVSTVSAHRLLQQAIEARNEEIHAVPQAVVYQKLQVRKKRPGPQRDSMVTWEIWNDTSGDRFGQRVEDATGSRFIYSAPAGATVRKPAYDEDSMPPLLKGLGQIFQTNEMDWRSPLSAAAYEAWRKSIQRKSERVIETESGTGEKALGVITTGAGPFPLNAIVEGELVVRTRDWHPVEQRLRVQEANGIHDYELAEVGFAVVALNTLLPPIFAESPQSRDLPHLSLKSARPLHSRLEPGEAELLAAEIEAHYALHEAKACLGETIEVVRDGSQRLIVRGIAETADRKQELLLALQNVRFVKVEIRTIQEAAHSTSEERSQAVIVETSPSSFSKGEPPHNSRPAKVAIHDYLERYLTQLRPSAVPELKEARTVPAIVQEEMTQLANECYSSATAALSEAWALRRLAERYGHLTIGNPAATDGIRLTSRGLLKAMMQDHVRSLNARVENLRSSLGPILISILEPNPPVEMAEKAESSESQTLQDHGWPDQTLRLFADVQKLHRLTLDLFSEEGPTSRPVQENTRDLLSLFHFSKAEVKELETDLGTAFSGDPDQLTLKDR